MTRRRVRFTAITTTTTTTAILLSLFSLLISTFLLASSTTVDLDPTSMILNHHRPPIFLPLYPSPRSLDANLRRHLQAKLIPPTARMNLFDDLLSNGYYTTRLYIGTPWQEFAVIVDTGSTVTYVPCFNCQQCGEHQNAKFQPDLSVTFYPVKCSPDCTCDADNTQCLYERHYAEDSSSSGVLAEDYVSFGTQSELNPQLAVFGCEKMETGGLYSQHADGIMGLGRGNLSIVDQLVKQGAIGDSFSLCYGGMGIGGGNMILGSISPPSGMVFTHSDPNRSSHYNIELKELHVAGKKLPVDSNAFDGNRGTILDSGTTYAYLPEPAFLAFKDAISSELHGLEQIGGPDPNFNDICYSGAGRNISELTKTFPAVDMVFENGQKYSLSPENYLFNHSKVPGAYCLGVLQNGKDLTTLLGGIVVRNTLVTYDREHSKIGFWKTNCSLLWEELRISESPAPAPEVETTSTLTPSSGENSSPGISPPPAPELKTTSTRTPSNGIYSVPGISPPASAPDGVASYVIPGETEVGFITFDMTLSIKDSDLRPRVSELSSFISQWLEINISQVYLLNLNSSGNGSLITWRIYPERSAKSIETTTAMHIIAHLAEPHVKLPDTFGSYELVNWKVDPPIKRNWWQHYAIVVMAVILSLIVGLSIYGILFMRKRRLQTNIQYKPVERDALILEQELQPL